MWNQIIPVPTESWLWHEMTSMHGVYDLAYDVRLDLAANLVAMTLRGAKWKRGRLIVLPWEL